VQLAPHGKTTMSPQLFRRQLDAGAWGLTFANVHQLRLGLAARAARADRQPARRRGRPRRAAGPAPPPRRRGAGLFVDSQAQLDALAAHWAAGRGEARWTC
jgi:D-serine dehydratase